MVTVVAAHDRLRGRLLQPFRDSFAAVDGFSLAKSSFVTVTCKRSLVRVRKLQPRRDLDYGNRLRSIYCSSVTWLELQQTRIRNSRPSARVPAPGCAAIGRQLRW